MRYLTSLAIAIMVCIMVTPAHATLQVNIGGTVSGGTVTGGALFTDNCTVVGPNCTSVDLLPGTTGSLSFVYSGLGTFTISTLNATSHSPTAILSMTINGDVAADTTFTVAITDTGFSIPAPPIMLAQDVHGTAAPANGATGSITGTGYYGASNTAFDTSGTQTGLASAPALNGAFGTASSAPILSGSPYSLTEFITVTLKKGTGLDQGVQINANLDAIQVPEPASVLLLGGVLFLTAGSLRRRLRRV